MPSDVECPYCGQGVEICHDDGYGYEEDETHEQDCPHCGKTFAYTTTIHFYYDAQKADCLNGAEHNMKPVMVTPQLHTHWNRCCACGHEDKGPIDQAKWDTYFRPPNAVVESPSRSAAEDGSDSNRLLGGDHVHE